MNKQDIRQGLKTYGELVTIKEVAEYLRVSRNTVSRMLQYYTCLQIGKAKKYHINDVAEAVDYEYQRIFRGLWMGRDIRWTDSLPFSNSSHVDWFIPDWV